jgi:hypothetical protein
MMWVLGYLKQNTVFDTDRIERELHIRWLYEQLKNNSKVSWKDSIKKVMFSDK